MAKKKKTPKKTMQIWKLYQTTGDKVERKNKTCPKCGPGMFLALHKDRVTCGNCSYSEITTKKE